MLALISFNNIIIIIIIIINNNNNICQHSNPSQVSNGLRQLPLGLGLPTVKIWRIPILN
jgi:hypothetical protein